MEGKARLLYHALGEAEQGRDGKRTEHYYRRPTNGGVVVGTCMICGAVGLSLDWE